MADGPERAMRRFRYSNDITTILTYIKPARVHESAGRVMVLVHPETQEAKGLTRRCLGMARIRELEEELEK